MQTSRDTKISGLIDRSGFTTDELANKLNVSAGEIERWKADAETVPYEHRNTLAGLLGVPVDQIAPGGTNTS